LGGVNIYLGVFNCYCVAILIPIISSFISSPAGEGWDEEIKIKAYCDWYYVFAPANV